MHFGHTLLLARCDDVLHHGGLVFQHHVAGETVITRIFRPTYTHSYTARARLAVLAALAVSACTAFLARAVPCVPCGLHAVFHGQVVVLLRCHLHPRVEVPDERRRAVVPLLIERGGRKRVVLQIRFDSAVRVLRRQQLRPVLWSVDHNSGEARGLLVELLINLLLCVEFLVPL